MPNVITNTSPLIYLHRAEVLDWLNRLFDSVWVPGSVIAEIQQGRRLGYEVPDVEALPWLQVVDPAHLPYKWLALDLWPGELAAMALGLENPERILLLDDNLARRTAVGAGLSVWGTLRVILEAKDKGLTPSVGLVVERLRADGMWISEAVRDRILKLAGE